MAIEIVTFRIVGTSPLMQSNPASMADDATTSLRVKRKYNDVEEAERRVYRNADGHFVHPSAAFRSCMMTAVKGRKWGKDYARNLLAGGVFPVETDCVILNGNGQPAKHYEIDKRPVRVGKALVQRCRPKFFPWSMLLPSEVEVEVVTPEHVLEALKLGGRIIGIAEFRPDPSNAKTGVGTFGRFTAEFASNLALPPSGKAKGRSR